MIIPINNGRTITSIYIPPVVRTNSGALQQNNTTTQNNGPTLATWIVSWVFLIFLIAVAVFFIKLLKELFGGEDE